ncbi:MAG: PQQ-binding-like beta-propeller repeat protein [Planctomycetes bacterium]|nr:PQQ-binding-like beta-propeller repeat protein [Planctomycetota bacterium]
MALKGDLASVDLAQVFQMLALNKKVGLLSVQSAKIWRVLYFDHRGVTLWYNPFQMCDRVLAALVRTGRLAESTLAEARELTARAGGSVIDSLLAGGSLTDQEIEAQIRVEQEEEIYDLFFCKDARFEFYEGIDRLEGRDGVVDARFFANCDSVIMEAARRIDEWSYITERIPSGVEVYRATGLAPTEDVEPDAIGVFDLVDGRRSVNRVVEVCGEAAFPVFKRLCRLLDAGMIEPLPPEDLVAAGNESMREGRVADAIALFERAIGFGIGVPDVHTLASVAYQAAEQFENAAYHLKCEAEYRFAAGDVLGACTRLCRAIQVTPTDLATHERLLELVLGNPGVRVDDYDPLAAGKELVDLYMLVGDMKHVRSVLEHCLRVHPDDLDLKRVLVNVHTKAGDNKKVMEVFESIADDLVRVGRPLEAVGYLQKILMLDRTRVDVSEKVRQLYEFDERGRSRRRSLAVLAFVFVVLVSIGVGYHFYDQQATRAFEAIAVQADLERNDFGAAAAAYEQFAAGYPLTMAVARAEEELVRIAGLRQKYEAEQSLIRAERQRELGRLRADYKAAWQKHRELFLAGNPEAALTALESARSLVVTAGESADLAWALEEQVEKTWSRLSAFLREAKELEQAVADELAAGRWETAREASLRLLKDYDITEVARRVRVPVLVTSRPQGARILADGVELKRSVAGGEQPMVTPSVVLCAPNAVEALSLVRGGFEAQQVTFEARKQPIVDVVLRVAAGSRFQFAEPVGQGVQARDGWLVAGLRGGKVGIAPIDGGAPRVLQLPGLRAMDGTPVVAVGRVWFLTNESTIECVDLAAGTSLPGWPVKVVAGAASEIMAQDGRLAVVDRDGVLHCFEQQTGAPLWMVPLEGSPAGPPTMERRVVRVATTDGRLLSVDAADGRVLAVLRCPTAINTRVLAADGLAFFGCADGRVRAVDEQDGRILWATDVGRQPADGELLLTAAGIVVCGSNDRLLVLATSDGSVQRTATLPGAAQRGLLADDTHLFVRVKLAKSRERKAQDVLQARAVGDLALVWEFADILPTGGLAVSGGGVFVADAQGGVVMFQ